MHNKSIRLKCDCKKCFHNSTVKLVSKKSAVGHGINDLNIVSEKIRCTLVDRISQKLLANDGEPFLASHNEK